MRLEECYRLLDLDPGATDKEVKTAWRDLTKVWHPDRFGHDRAVQRKAEEKLKAINDAYERIRAHREGTPAPETRRRFPAVAIALAFAGLFVLLRRPTTLGLVIAGILFFVSFVLFMRMR
jgi:ferric-dicitrate binding protein FerR (iron transport regulator)